MAEGTKVINLHSTMGILMRCSFWMSSANHQRCQAVSKIFSKDGTRFLAKWLQNTSFQLQIRQSTQNSMILMASG